MKKRCLSLFDHSGHIKKEFISNGWYCSSLDIEQNKKNNSVDIVTNILDWDYKAFVPGYFDFMFIALPCQAYSIASGGSHFKKSIPLTPVAINAINILIRIYQITQYFKCDFIIENPSGGLVNNAFFKSFFKLNITRLTLNSFGFPTQKKTDLFYTSNMLLVVPVTVRKNNRYAKKSLDSLSYRSRVTYPQTFVSFIVENIIINEN